MDEISQWEIAVLIGTSIAALLAWFNKYGCDFKDGFESKAKGQKEIITCIFKKTRQVVRIPIKNK